MIHEWPYTKTNSVTGFPRASVENRFFFTHTFMIGPLVVLDVLAVPEWDEGGLLTGDLAVNEAIV
jgi:hypothetical protein